MNSESASEKAFPGRADSLFTRSGIDREPASSRERKRTGGGETNGASLAGFESGRPDAKLRRAVPGRSIDSRGIRRLSV